MTDEVERLRSSAPAVKVKPLVWEQVDKDIWIAHGIEQAEYMISQSEDGDWYWPEGPFVDDDGPEIFGGFKAVQDFVQARHDRRILSAIETRPAGPQGARETSERYKLVWIAGARPPAHPDPMRGRQTFDSFDAAAAFFADLASDAQFVSLSKITTDTTTVNVSDALRAAVGEPAMPDPDRWSQRFAYLPAQMSDGRWIWWQTYFTRTSRHPINGGPGILIRPAIQKVARIPEPKSIPLPRPPKK